MESKEKNGEDLVKVPEKALLSLVAGKLKDRDLFPEKLEQAKECLQTITVAISS